VLRKAEEDHEGYSDQSLSPTELDDLSVQKFRVYAITHMVQAVTESFMENLAALLDGSFSSDLVTESRAKFLVKRLKAFAFSNAYKHRSVLEVELTGANTIHGLMDILWYAIQTRTDPANIGSERSDPFANYVYTRISENYRRVCESASNLMPIRYRELQLLTDMISGMTDSFAMSLYAELRTYDARPRS
jgi:dGTPase